MCYFVIILHKMSQQFCRIKILHLLWFDLVLISGESSDCIIQLCFLYNYILNVLVMVVIGPCTPFYKHVCMLACMYDCMHMCKYAFMCVCARTRTRMCLILLFALDTCSHSCLCYLKVYR